MFQKLLVWQVGNTAWVFSRENVLKACVLTVSFLNFLLQRLGSSGCLEKVVRRRAGSCTRSLEGHRTVGSVCGPPAGTVAGQVGLLSGE